MLTNTEIEAIRKRAEEATEGPWIIEESRYGGYYNAGNPKYDYSACISPENDIEFIANAREDIPKLLSEIERLRDELSFILNVDMTKNAHDAEHVAISVKSWAHRALYGGDSE